MKWNQGSSLKISSIKSNIHHNKMVELSILAFTFSKRPFMLWRWAVFAHFITMLWRWYDVWCCPFFYWLNALLSTSFDQSWICTWFIIFLLTHDMLLYFDFSQNDCVNLCTWSKLWHFFFSCIFFVDLSIMCLNFTTLAYGVFT
jgi:hypothetical protein